MIDVTNKVNLWLIKMKKREKLWPTEPPKTVRKTENRDTKCSICVVCQSRSKPGSATLRLQCPVVRQKNTKSPVSVTATLQRLWPPFLLSLFTSYDGSGCNQDPTIAKIYLIFYDVHVHAP